MEFVKDIEERIKREDYRSALELCEKLKDNKADLITHIKLPSLCISFYATDTDDKKGLIITGYRDGGIVAFDFAGKIRWKKRLIEGDRVNCITTDIGEVGGDVLFIGSKDGYLYLLNPISGADLWTKRLKGEILSIYATSVDYYYTQSLSKKQIRLIKEEGMSNEIFLGMAKGAMCIDNLYTPQHIQEERRVFNRARPKSSVHTICAYDIDGDGHNEVILGLDDGVHIFTHTGEEIVRYQTRERIEHILAEDREIVAAGKERVYLFEYRKGLGWQVLLDSEVKAVRVEPRKDGRKGIAVATETDLILLDDKGEKILCYGYQGVEDLFFCSHYLVLCFSKAISIYDYPVTRQIELYTKACRDQIAIIESRIKERRRLSEIPNPYPSPKRLLSAPLVKDVEEAEKVLESPAVGILDLAKVKGFVMKLAGYQPTIVQLIGFHLFEHLKRKMPDEVVWSRRRFVVSKEDLTGFDITKRVESWLCSRWKLSRSERFLITALAHTDGIRISSLLERFPLLTFVMSKKDRDDAVESVVNKGIIQKDAEKLLFSAPIFIKLFQRTPLSDIFKEIWMITPLSSFHKMDESLRKKGLLEQVISGMQIEKEVWDRAVESSRRWARIEDERGRLIEENVDDFIRLVCELLGFEIKERKERSGIISYTLRVSSVNIRTSENTPFFVTKLSSLGQADSAFEKVREMVSHFGVGEGISFLLVKGRADRMRRLAEESLINIVVLEEKEIKRLIISDSCPREFVRTISEQHGVTIISPYETQAPVPERMFYGRKSQVKLLAGKQDTNFAIIGGRKIGKTSLMKKVAEILRREKCLCLYLDCSVIDNTQGFIVSVAERLGGVKEAVSMSIGEFPRFLRRVHKKCKKRITLLLDEIDSLLYYDRMRSNIWLRVLRVSFQEGYCRYIVSGFRELFVEQKRIDSPLFNFMQPVRISVLDEKSARDLIVEPMTDLGIRFIEREKIVKEILYQTSCHPNIIQFHCNRLIQLLDEKKSLNLSLEDVEKVKKSPEFEDFIAGTFLEIADSLERLIVFLTIDEEGITEELVDKKLKDRGVNLSLKEFERELENLELANILTKEGDHYRFSYPAFPYILKRKYNIEFMLRKTLEEIR
jgi:hypothetical protein